MVQSTQSKDTVTLTVEEQEVATIFAEFHPMI
jgi:hypothetical protein